jgi:predicted nucleotidyltransferase
MPQQTPSKQLNRVARQFAKELKDRKEVEGIFVFGSVAANVATTESDIDLLVSVPKLIGNDLRDVAAEFNQRTGAHIKIHTTHSESIRRIMGGHSTASGTRRILSEGSLPLYLDKKAFPENKYPKSAFIKRFAPRRRTIMQKYGEWGKGNREMSLEFRMTENAKRTKSRFRPPR